MRRMMTRPEMDSLMVRLKREKWDAENVKGRESVEFKVAEAKVSLLIEVMLGHSEDSMEVCQHCGTRYPMGHDWEGHICSRK